MCAFVDLLCSRLCGKCCAHVISSVCASVRAAITQLEKDFPDHTPSVDEVAVWLSWDQALGFFVWEGTGSFKGCVLGEKPILHSAVLISCHKLFLTLVFSIFGGCHPVIKRWAALSLISKPWLTREPPASALDHWSWGRW